MTLYSYLFPQVRPGVHTVTTDQTFTGVAMGAQDTVPGRTHAIEITAPRYAMGASEVFGVFPPPNGSGPFAARLAQIVLRNRTLPWERSSSAAQPWLALVVLADGEATFRPDVVAAEAYSVGRVPTGIPNDARAACVEVPRKVIDDTFPAATELELMTHVRQVNTLDTEYADDDGWVSVLVSNRLPQPSTSYAAYLISVEGQTDLLPGAGQVANDIDKHWAFDDLLDFAVAEAVWPRIVDPNVFVQPSPRTTHSTQSFAAHDVRSTMSSTGTAVDSGAMRVPSAAKFVGHDVDFTKFADHFGLNPALFETFRFPVLAHWEFRCSDEAGDFAGYMNHLEDGLLGSAPIVDPRAPVVPVTPTGHVSIESTDRRGETGKVWFRGAGTPTKVTRETAGHPYHVADQARRLGPDGREDVSYAAAFELGRLLAMSDLQFVRALRDWVRREFVVRRNNDVVNPYFTGLHINLPYNVTLPKLITNSMLLPGGIGGDPMTELGNPLPIHEADALLRANDIDVLATGLGLSQQVVARALGDELMNGTVAPGTVDLGLNSFEEVRGNTVTFTGLEASLDEFIGEFNDMANTMGQQARDGTAGPLLGRMLGGRP